MKLHRMANQRPFQRCRTVAPSQIGVGNRSNMAAAVLTSAPVSSAGIKSSLAALIDSDRILIRPIDLIAYASDASFYRLIPRQWSRLGALRRSKALFEFSQREGIPMTFRAAGSSLSGQSISDGLLVEVARHWRDLKVEDGGKKNSGPTRRDRAREPINSSRPYGAKIGPDPASIATCTWAEFSPTTLAACVAAWIRTLITRCAPEVHACRRGRSSTPRSPTRKSNFMPANRNWPRHS